MATILLAWELGGGFGHLGNLRPVAQNLLARGHRVVAAMRDVAKARTALDLPALEIIQAPLKSRGAVRDRRLIVNFAQVLRSVGWSSGVELSALVGAWRWIMTQVRPEVLVCEHSPTALLAARGLGIQHGFLGVGFSCPLPTEPLPSMRPWIRVEPEKLLAQERVILGTANQALHNHGVPPLASLGELFDNPSFNWLTTIAELDHYQGRKAGFYTGFWADPRGQPPEWPSGRRPRIFGYLKPFKGLPKLVAQLGANKCPTLLVTQSLPSAVLKELSSGSVRVINRALDLSRVAAECDLAILNGTHATTGYFLLQGKPALHIPLVLEQALTAKRIMSLGCGLSASPNNAEMISQRLAKMLAEPSYGQRAQQFAKRYQGPQWQDSIGRLTADVERVVP